jgi:hypothetical protein
MILWPFSPGALLYQVENITCEATIIFSLQLWIFLSVYLKRCMIQVTTYKVTNPRLLFRVSHRYWIGCFIQALSFNRWCFDMKMLETKVVMSKRTRYNPFNLQLIWEMQSLEEESVIQLTQNLKKLNHLDYLTLRVKVPRFFENSIII